MIKIPEFVIKFGGNEKGTLLTEADADIIKSGISKAAMEAVKNLEEAQESVSYEPVHTQ